MTRRMAMAAGGFSAALGLSVILGWHIHSAALVQVVPGFVPMPYNTALGFLLCGVGLLLAAARPPRLTLLLSACGALAAAIGLLTLIQCSFGIELGIDQLLMEPYITVKTSHPGRMAPTTAVSFILAGSSLLVLRRTGERGRPQGPSRALPVAGVCAAVLLTVGAVTFLGYLSGLENPFGLSEARFTLMAVHTAAGFGVLGAGVLTLALAEGRSEGEGLPGWLPYPVGAVGLTLAVVLWQLLVMQQDNHIRREIALEANSVRTEFEALLTSRVDALDRMVRRWERRGGTPRDEWEADAALYLLHQPDLRAIRWADSSLQPIWSVLAEEQPEAEVPRDQPLAWIAERKSGLEAARERRGPLVVTEASERGRLNAELLIYVPLFPAGQFDGFLHARFHVAGLSDRIGRVAVDEGYSYAVFDGERESFGRYEVDRRHEEEWGQEAAVGVYDVPWRFRAWPRPETLAEARTRFPETILAVTLLLALLIPLTVRYAQTARGRARRAEKLTRLLKDDVARRKNVEESLQRAQSANDLARDAIYWVREDGRIFYVNEAACRHLGYSRDELLSMCVPEIDPDFPTEAWPEHWAQMKEAGSLTFEAHHQTKGGRVFPVEITTTFLGDASEEFIWAYVRDITERQSAAAERRQSAEDLARANAELRHFNKMAVGRELRMIELKREVNEVLESGGKAPAYDTSFAPDVLDLDAAEES